MPMRILSKTRFWQYLWDYMPEWSEENDSLGEPEDLGEKGQPNDQQGPQSGGFYHDPDGNQEAPSEGEPDNDQDGNESQSGLSDEDQDDDGPDEGPEEDQENSESEGSEDHDSDGEFRIEEPPTRDRPTIPGYRMVKNPDGSEDYIREFDSWWAFVQTAMRPDLYAWHKTGKKVSHAGRDFKGHKGSETNTFAEAVEMALKTGWPAGRKLLDDSLTAIAQAPRPVDQWSFDVAGAFPLIPMFCAGDPACMVIDPASDLKTQTPIVRIDYNSYAGHDILPKDMMLRGAAVVSLANNLERAGVQTELRIIANASGLNYGLPKQTFRLSVVYKRAGEQLDLDRAAFAIAHPATMRRLMFAILEQHADLEDNFHSGYGLVMQEANDKTSGQPGGAIFVQGSNGNETVARARRTVEVAAQAVLGADPTPERRAA